MESGRFYEGIHMMPEAIREAEKLLIPEKDYQEKKELFRTDKKAFYNEILKERDFRIRFLYYYSRMACETYAYYQRKKIEDKIYWDTFYDLTIWCENCFRKYGEYGIAQYDWFFRHIECRIFRLGRLEFEKMKSEWELTDDGIQINKGDDVISVHIPEGGKLEPEQIRDSYRQAYEFWGMECPYICHSWLLYPGLSDVLGENSNILKFQKQYRILKTDFIEREAEERIFGTIQGNPEKYQEETSLQRRAKQYLLSGKQLGNGIGVLLFTPCRAPRCTASGRQSDGFRASVPRQRRL